MYNSDIYAGDKIPDLLSRIPDEIITAIMI